MISPTSMMTTMKVGMLTFLVLLEVTNWVQALTTIPEFTDFELEKQLALINKPAVKSFQTKYGDVVDCVEIHKQLAFDHPLLKNHSIQMKPTSDILWPRKSSSSVLRASQLFLKNDMRCPKGTVPIKRAQKEDLLMMKFPPSILRTNLMSSSSKYDDQMPEGHQVASIVVLAKNVGIHGMINVWGVPNIEAQQISSASMFVANDDGPNINGIAAGWLVNPNLYPDSTRLYAFWSKDEGKTTGCYNTLCPGFVQVSQEITLGMILQPLSTYGGPQTEIELSINQDTSTGNWWLIFGTKKIGYYPKELFTTLAKEADRAGWGGEIASPITKPSPPMGSGHFPEEGFGKACYMKQMSLLDSRHSIFYPEKDAQEINSKPDCYRASYAGVGPSDLGPYMYFGGPPNCKL